MTNEERIKILEMVAAGKLTVEQASQLMDKLGTKSTTEIWWIHSGDNRENQRVPKKWGYSADRSGAGQFPSTANCCFEKLWGRRGLYQGVARSGAG